MQATQITELAAKLETLGLSDKEARVYVANLFLGPAPVQRIAEQAGINRATTYVILDQLCQLGLTSQSQEGKKTVYVADGPEALGRLFDRQQEQVEERRKELEALLPELQHMERSPDSRAPVVRFYRGKEAMWSLNAESRRKSKPGSQIYAFLNYDELSKALPEMPKENPRLRLKKKISTRVLYSSDKTEVSSDKKLLREAKKVATPVAAEMTLFPDRAVFLEYGDDPVAIVIEGTEIVTAFRQLFELSWNNTKK